MSAGQVPSGDFKESTNCPCGFLLDEYDDGRYRIKYVDPDTCLVVDRCPECRRYLDPYGQAR